jgi:hypothetical protein
MNPIAASASTSISTSASTTDTLAGYANSPEHTHTYPVRSSPSSGTSFNRRTRTVNPAALVGVYTRQLALTEEMISATRTGIMGLFGTVRRVQIPAWFEVLREYLIYRDYCLRMLRRWEERLREESSGEVESLSDGSESRGGDESASSKSEKEEDGSGEEEGTSAVATASKVQHVSEETNATEDVRATNGERVPWEEIPDGLMARWRARREDANPSATNLPAENQASYRAPSPAALPTFSTESEDYYDLVSSL